MRQLILILMLLFQTSCITKVQIIVIKKSDNVDLNDIDQRGSDEPGKDAKLKLPTPGG